MRLILNIIRSLKKFKTECNTNQDTILNEKEIECILKKYDAVSIKPSETIDYSKWINVYNTWVSYPGQESISLT